MGIATLTEGIVNTNIGRRNTIPDLFLTGDLLLFLSRLTKSLNFVPWEMRRSSLAKLASLLAYSTCLPLLKCWEGNTQSQMAHTHTPHTHPHHSRAHMYAAGMPHTHTHTPTPTPSPSGDPCTSQHSTRSSLAS